MSETRMRRAVPLAASAPRGKLVSRPTSGIQKALRLDQTRRGNPTPGECSLARRFDQLMGVELRGMPNIHAVPQMGLRIQAPLITEIPADTFANGLNYLIGCFAQMAHFSQCSSHRVLHRQTGIGLIAFFLRGFRREMSCTIPS